MKDPSQRPDSGGSAFVEEESTPRAAPTVVLLTTYFCRNADPQRKVCAPPNDITYIAPWYESVSRLGLPGVVFHDGMSQDFIHQYQTESIAFEYVDPESFTCSVNDFRFFIYLEFLRKRPEIERVFMTDGNDVQIVQDPFPLLRSNRIYVGSELERIEESQWMRRRIWQLNEGSPHHRFRLSRFRKHTIYNAGILGGHRGIVLQFLEKMVDTLGSLGPDHKHLNLNMAAFNYLVHRHFRWRSRTGDPVHSRYKAYENHRRDVWFIHK
jgi:hypothetical protein